MGEAAKPFELQLLGPLTVRRDGAAELLPASRKTRALLAYLTISGKPERRERLCELFWDVPDDPRGALRWSLSKLRPVVDSGDEVRLLADREWVEIRLPDEAVDWRRLKSLAQRGVARAPTEALQAAAGGGELLEGLELPRCERFRAWSVAHREDVVRWRGQVLRELTGRALPPETAIAHARAWVELDGDSPEPWRRLVGLLESAGRTRDADEHRALAERRLRAAGGQAPADLRARPAAVRAAAAPPAADIRFCSASDGVSIAYTVQGGGPPLVKTANWMTHLQRDAEGPIWRHWIAEFTKGRAFVRYDQRGNGLSDWNAPFSVEAFVDDLERVVDAAGLERFDLLGISQGAGVAVAYAVRHPERVRRIVLLGGFVKGWALHATPEERERREAMLTLTRTGWDLDTPAFRQMFTSLFIPDGGSDDQHWFNTTQKLSTNGENAYAIQRCGAEADVEPLLPRVAAPTLVAHCRGDAVVPFATGREIASRIPGARFLPLEGRNHIILEQDAAWRRFADAARAFLDEADGA
ncbi:adenylate/guanylate cyclase/hydrolase, alpha/beta fold family protein [Phenylobacterium zucineum HLK1]|uniref:Adenylate/guanylate cyclase/hydrolase, alpha/beta fold family protein n=1 Tax=Phenylobacterium zucineum (strain HLK1) TaxID=450851 RepID=B4R7V7_PHEZH|nr:alpha/beta fold hydrolase [Phenylobacterium zucineum]ACG77490.1 adenylate/guanylate cyclase/hydrolase, alpha/beta fold family protein [Phenylobacterium zucineum HLK1]